MGFQVAYVPIGVGTFHLESAQDQFEKSVSMLRGLTADCAVPEKMLLTINDLDAYLDTISPDLIVLQNITFANAAYASEVLKRFDCPIVLWTLREPVIDGTRLRLNSLTGAYSAGNAITAFRGEGRFEYIFGAPTEEEVKAEIGAAIRAAKVKYDLRRLKMISIGHTPQGFGFGRALDAEMMSTFGTTLDSIEARELINKAKGYTEEELADELTEARRTIVGLDTIPEKNVVNFARLYKAYKSYVARIGSALCAPAAGRISSPSSAPGVQRALAAQRQRCFCQLRVGRLRCTLHVHWQRSDRPFLLLWRSRLDERAGEHHHLLHCGMAACDLARKDTGAQVGVHPNRKIGPVMDFGCEACECVTLFRVGRKPDGSFRFFVAEGAALDKPKQFNGTSVVVKTAASAKEVVYGTVKGGWEPHFVVVYGQVANELEKLGNMLGVEVCKF